MKNNFLFRIFLVVFLCSYSLNLAAQEKPPKDDLQLWTESHVFFPRFDPKINYGFINISRIGREVSTLTDERNGGFIGYQFAPEFTLTAIGMHINQDPIKEVHTKQDRVMLDATGSIEIEKDFHFIYRARYEKQYRILQEDGWEIRPRIGLDHDYYIDNVHIKPFVNTEGFYRSLTSEWYRLRTLVGVNFPIDPSFSCDLYVGKQNNRDPSATDLTMIGLTFKMKMPDF